MPKRMDLTGQRYGHLVAKKHIGLDRHRQTVWLWKCDCGNEKEILAYIVKTGRSKSCGCYKGEYSRINSTKHGGVGTKLYSIWGSMKERCSNSNNHNFKYYGGRGIKVCEEWNDFILFREWALSNGYSKLNVYGERLTIDRINNNGNYEPSNCRWATYSQQAKNKRYKISQYVYTKDGETKTLKEWANEYNYEYTTMVYRYHHGKDIFKKPNYQKNLLNKKRNYKVAIG
jgi:hypothetical protein